MENLPDITGVWEKTDEEPLDNYDTTDVDIEQDYHQDEQEDHEERHNSYEQNNANLEPPQDDNHDAPQEQDIGPIEESP